MISRIVDAQVGIDGVGGIQSVIADIGVLGSASCTVRLTNRAVVTMSASQRATVSVGAISVSQGSRTFVLGPGDIPILFSSGASISFFPIFGEEGDPFEVGGNFSASVIFQENPPSAALRALEVTQSIQDWYCSAPLISNKTTFARAFLEAGRLQDQGRLISGQLRGFDARTHSELPGSPLQPFTAATLEPVVGGPASFSERAALPSDAAIARTITAANVIVSLNFILPQAWTQAGLVDLKFEGTDADIEYRDPPDLLEPPSIPGTTGGDGTVRAQFEATPRPHLLVAPIQIARPGVPLLTGPTAAEIIQMMVQIEHMYPVDRFEWELREPIVFDTRVQPLKPDNVLASLVNWHHSEAVPNVLCLGLMKEQDLLTAMHATVLPGRATTGQSDTEGGASFALDDNYRTLAHELGHLLGRFHPADSAVPPLIIPLTNGNLTIKYGDCGEDCPGDIPDFPYLFQVPDPGNSSSIVTRPTLGPMNGDENDKFYGWEWGRNRYIPRLPSESFELMSYCDPQEKAWISFETYREVWFRIRGQWGSPTPPSPAPLALARLAAANSSGILLVRGVVDLVRDTVQWLPFKSYPEATLIPPPQPGAYTLRLLDSGAAVLSEVTFDVSFPEGPDAETGALRQPFSIALAADPAARQVLLLHNGVAIGSQTASANPPIVTVLSPNGGETLNSTEAELRWQASDPDGDSLVFTVQYSADGGLTWRTLAVDYSETNLVVQTADLCGTAQGRIRVLASDGFFSGNDQSDGSFTVPDKDPISAILEPADSTTFYGEEMILFEGVGLDREDGRISDGFLVWKSDRDGVFGNGGTITRLAHTMSEGEHLITLTSYDSAGHQTSATNRITIRRALPMSLSISAALSGVETVVPISIRSTPLTRSVIEISSNLVDWTIFRSLAQSNVEEVIYEAVVPLGISRFYRAHSESLPPSAPTMIVQPPSTNGVAGQTFTIFAEVSGELPMSYQWLFNGAPIATATNFALRFDSVQATQSGAYSLIISNNGGAVTSEVAVVTITGPIYQVLHQFGTNSLDGINGWGPLTIGSDGALYGCARNGAIANAGVVFKLQTNGGDYSVLHRFQIATEGGTPLGGVIEGDDGALYGTTSAGGTNSAGTIFTLNKDGTSFTVLHHFLSTADGRNPQAELLEASDGLLYGTAYNGGGLGHGGIFRLSRSGTGYTNFSGFNFGGSELPHQPLGGLIEGLDGVLYGTTEQGGLSNKGTIFKINKDGTGATVLKSLGLIVGGAEQPNCTLLQAGDGQLYGTAALGGTAGFGAVIRISTNGTNFGVIHNFTAVEGQEPRAGLVESPNGFLLGTTRVGGGPGSGVVFRVTTDGSYATLHSFIGSPDDGGRSRSRLLYRDGFYYGMTFGGGTSDQGVIFRLLVPGLGP